MANDLNDTTRPSVDASSPETHSPHYWFEDGSVIARLRNHDFKVHRGLLNRHSPYLASLPTRPSDYDLPTVEIPDERATSEDFEGLLGYLYHDTYVILSVKAGLDLPYIVPRSLDTTSTFSRISSLLRVSSDKQLHYPPIHDRARTHFAGLFPTSVEAFVHPEDPETALALAIEHDIGSVQKPLYYSVATTLHFEHGESDHTSTLPKDATLRCAALQDSLIAHFTPILFTVATASHMECTNVFAEKWMPLVIAPALADNGLCTPVETLRTIQKIKWEDEGLCEECCREKRAEWEEEARTVWDKVDGWLNLPVGRH